MKISPFCSCGIHTEICSTLSWKCWNNATGKKSHSARSWEYSEVQNVGSLLPAISMPWFSCFSLIFFFPEYWQSCVCWEFSQNQYGLHEAASICHGFLVQRTAKSSVFGTWGRLNLLGFSCPSWSIFWVVQLSSKSLSFKIDHVELPFMQRIRKNYI